jgi:hypothetical protein
MAVERLTARGLVSMPASRRLNRAAVCGAGTMMLRLRAWADGARESPPDVGARLRWPITEKEPCRDDESSPPIHPLGRSDHVMPIVGVATAWAMDSPVGAGPDEPNHILHAYGVATGQTAVGHRTRTVTIGLFQHALRWKPNPRQADKCRSAERSTESDSTVG